MADGSKIPCAWTSPIRIEMCGRVGDFNALAAPLGAKVLLGQLPLEQLDLVVEPSTGRVIPNPAHPDGPVAYA